MFLGHQIFLPDLRERKRERDLRMLQGRKHFYSDEQNMSLMLYMGRSLDGTLLLASVTSRLKTDYD